MTEKKFRKTNNIIAVVILALSAFVYLSTIEPTASFWDCGEFIASSYKLEVGHPPGNPVFQMIARIFTLFVGKEHVAAAVDSMSALCSALTIFFLFLTIVHFGRRLVQKTRGGNISDASAIAIFASGIVGALAYCFSDTFWFSAVEGEVYAMSSLFTAVVFWCMLKWEEEDNPKYANRWIVLIALLMGLSIGVHLLNLLTIPPMVFIYYYKKTKKPVTFWRGFGVLILSFLLLAFLLFIVIPYIPKIAAYVDLLFVNVFHTHFNVGAVVFVVLLLAACIFGIYNTAKRHSSFWNTVLLCFTMIVIGYSAFAMCVIRASAKTPTNEYQPDNPFTLCRYLGREQYGSYPIIYGQSYVSTYSLKEPSYWTPLGNRYIKAKGPASPVYDAGSKMLFPRMWNSSDKNYVKYYDMYTHGKFQTSRRMINGEEKVVKRPYQKDNLTFFFDFQLNWMYVRYFMWNFVGRQNDYHGESPNLFRGNWESGIKFIDEARLGDQSDGPDYMVHAKGKNHYFFLPLLLGLIGLFYQISKDGRNSWITFLLFFLTGIAIVIYLNQPPLQVRERDYAYAGSFYVFTIWIGLGVTAIYQWFEGIVRSPGGRKALACIVGVVCLGVPTLMGAQNWNDHDRSGRYTARDIAYNYLNTCDKDAILITHGDNDTFPLWYAQEVEGIRTDVRVVNTSLLGTDWYIDQMKWKTYESDPLPITIDRKQYLYGTNDWVPVIEKIKNPVPLNDVIDIFKDPRFVLRMENGESYDFLPARKFIVPVNKDSVKKYHIVPDCDLDKVCDSVILEIPEGTDYISKTDLILLDVIAHYKWNRPIYILSLGGDTKIGLRNYLQFDGFAYKFVPIRSKSALMNMQQVNTDILFDKLMKEYRLDNLKDTTVDWDYQNLYTWMGVMPLRNMFKIEAQSLLDKGDTVKAVAILDRCIDVMPTKNFPYNFSILQSVNEYCILDIIDLYLKCGKTAEGMKLANEFVSESVKALRVFGSPYKGALLSSDNYQSTMLYFYYLKDIFEKNGLTDAAKSIGKLLYGGEGT
ncbi:MAG: DUF2723 domain-containing protein [Bacteroidales bacterium]|jgi:hypothetical protein|nr:DUF2723 domain-containing protein [Bacteroidales bacterium]